MLQVPHAIAVGQLAEQVERGQALLQRARIIGEAGDYSSWKVAREQWITLTTETLGLIYDRSDEAGEFDSAASSHAGDGKWQVDLERDLDCVRAAIGILISLQNRVETEHRPADASAPEQDPLVGSELEPAPAGGAELEESARRPESAQPATSSDGFAQGEMRRVFLVHGRNDRWKQAVVDVLEHAGSHAVIVLSDRSNGHGTVVEQFGQPGTGASFAVVLLTADDVGAPQVASDQEPFFSPRACQSVVFEMGFLVAALTPLCVCVLYEDGVELPCDLAGITYVRLDLAGAWQLQLLLRLRGAGFNYDLNRLAPV